MSDRYPPHPQPMTDPLGDAPEVASQPEQRQAWGQSAPPAPPEPPPEPVLDEADIKRGMPKKGLLTSVMTLGALAVLAMSMFPDLFQQKKEPPPPEIQTAGPPRVAEMLKSSVPFEPQAVAEPKPEPKASQQSRDDLQELILASKMEADEVSLDGSPQNAEELAAARANESIKERGASHEALLKDAMAKYDASAEQEKASALKAEADSKRSRAKNPDEAFLEESAARQIQPIEKIQDRRPQGTLYQGSVIRLVLDGAVRSDLPGMVRARVVSDVYDSINMTDLLIPRGSAADCRYQSAILVGQSRMLFGCERLRLPNGKFIRLPGNPAADLEGASGVPAEVDTHFWSRFGSVFMMGAASTFLPESEKTSTLNSNAGGVTQAGTVLGSALNQVISQTLSRNASIGPTGYIEPGSVFTMVTITDLQLEPYSGRGR